MSRRGQALDLHEIQLASLAEEMREEAATDGGGARTDARRAGPPRGGRAGALVVADPRRTRGAPPRSRGAGRPATIEYMAPDTPQPGSGAPSVRNERGVGLDVKELLKNEAFASNEPACDDHFDKNRPCPDAIHGVSDQYIVLDTFNKLPMSNIAQGEFQWNFMVQGVTGDEVVGVHDKIDTVIEVQIGSFSIPILEEVPYKLTPQPAAVPTGRNVLVLIQNNNHAAAPFNPLLLPTQYPLPVPTQTPWVDNPYSQVPFGNRMTVQLKEAGLQSYSDRNGARHHFEFNLVYLAGIAARNPNMLTALPINGTQWDTFTFTEPLKDVHGLTLVFRNPDAPISFLPDCYYDVDVSSDGAAAPGPFLRFTVNNHQLLVGDRIYVSGLKTGVGALDKYVNRPEGHVASGDPALPPLPPSSPIPTPNTFWLDPAVSIIDLTAPAPILPQIVTVHVAKRRMRIPMRLRRVVDRLTNYINL